MWKSFAASGHFDRAFVHTAKSATFCKPIVDYFLDVTSVSFAWLTDLTLADTDCSEGDLRQLAVLSSLRTLQVRYARRSWTRSQPFNNDTISHLAWRASTDGSLSRLQMIFVDTTQGISAAALKHLSSFPALETFCLCGTWSRSKHRSLSKKHGWREGVKYVECSNSRRQITEHRQHNIHEIRNTPRGEVKISRSDWVPMGLYVLDAGQGIHSQATL